MKNESESESNTIVDKIVVGLVASCVVGIAGYTFMKNIYLNSDNRYLTPPERVAHEKEKNPDLIEVQGITLPSSGVKLLYRKSTAEYIILVAGDTNLCYKLFAHDTTGTNKTLLMKVITTTSPNVIFPLSTPLFMELVGNSNTFHIEVAHITVEDYK